VRGEVKSKVKKWLIISGFFTLMFPSVLFGQNSEAGNGKLQVCGKCGVTQKQFYEMGLKEKPVYTPGAYRPDSTNSVSVNTNSLNAFKIPEGAVFAEELNGNAFIVSPEKTTVVKMSASDINRIVCTEGVSSEIRVVYPKRKGVNVKIVDNNAFVEFVVKKIGNKFIYQNTPVELYVICDNTVYSLIAFPQKIPAVTIYLENKAEKLKSDLKAVLELPYEKRIVQIVKAFFSDKPPIEAGFVKTNRKYDIYPGLEIRETGNYVFEGEGIIARIFVVSLSPQALQDHVDLREKDFLRKEITVSPIAVAVDRLRLARGEKTMVLILEKKPVLQEVNPFYYSGGSK